jgi:hypothetical protein
MGFCLKINFIYVHSYTVQNCSCKKWITNKYLKVFEQMKMSMIASMFLASALFSATPSLAADCSASAQQVVAQTGGQLLSAKAGTKSGQTVCKITVLVKGNAYQRSKKITVTVPQ